MKLFHESAYRKLALFVLILATTSSCSLTKGKAAAETAVARFHDQLNAGKYHEIYEESDAEFKKSVTEDELTTLLSAIQRKLGTPKSSSALGWRVNTTLNGIFAASTYETEFSEGKGQEEFVFHVTGDKAALYHYNVASPLLITR
jgi:uncharacterized protein DUF4019